MTVFTTRSGKASEFGRRWYPGNTAEGHRERAGFACVLHLWLQQRDYVFQKIMYVIGTFKCTLINWRH